MKQLTTTQPDNKPSTSQNNTEETHNKDYLTESIPLENGLTIRKIEDQWATTLGNTILTEKTNDYNGQLKQIDEINYKLIINIAIHVARTIYDQIEIAKITAVKQHQEKIERDKMTPIITPDGGRYETT